MWCLVLYSVLPSVDANLLSRLESGELKPQSHGIALVNIQTRIQLLYGEGYGLSFANAQNEECEETAAVTVRLPMKEGNA